jgi:hypothetical protein
MSADLVAKLFKYRRKVEYGDVELWMRIPGDQAIDDARTAALLESRRVRRQLRSSDTDEYLLYIDLVEDMDDDQIRAACITMAVRDVMRDYMNANPKPALPELGDYPTQEQQEEYTATKNQRDVDYADGLRLYVDSWREQYLVSLVKMETPQLKHIYRKLRTDRVCEEIYNEQFEALLLASSIFTDESCTNTAFSGEDMKKVPSDFKAKLKDWYAELSLSGDELKKS